MSYRSGRRGSLGVTSPSSPTYVYYERPEAQQPATRQTPPFTTGDSASSSFTVYPVGTLPPTRDSPTTAAPQSAPDFGDLVCDNIRQFLTAKQLQRAAAEHAAQYPVNPATPWRRSRDPGATATRHVEAPQSPTTTCITVERRFGDGDARRGSQGEGGTGADDRNLFKKYRFQFGSIGNFGRTNSRDVDDATGQDTGSGSGRSQPRSGPVAVFFFQDFDDMVAKIRELRERDQTLQGVGSAAGVQTSQQPG